MSIVFFFLFIMFSSTHSNAKVIDITTYANQPFGNVLFVRHAYAPGNGDPDNFNLNDCNTQRNLNEEGRKQAVRIGERMRIEGIIFKRVYSSSWCRCLETAKLLSMGEVFKLNGLNSFYQGIVPKEQTLTRLKKTLSNLKIDDHPVLMITHFVTIHAITGIAVKSGGAVAYDATSGTAKQISLSK